MLLSIVNNGGATGVEAYASWTGRQKNIDPTSTTRIMDALSQLPTDINSSQSLRVKRELDRIYRDGKVTDLEITRLTGVIDKINNQGKGLTCQPPLVGGNASCGINYYNRLYSGLSSVGNDPVRQLRFHDRLREMGLA
jgi:hypothetical protein